MAHMEAESVGQADSKREGGVSFVYAVPYTDRWGVLHDPTTWWDDLLKYYKHHARLIVSEATRQMAQPASAEALKIVRKALKRHRRNLENAHELETRYLKQRSHERRGAARRQTEALEAKYLKTQFAGPQVNRLESQRRL